MHLHWNSRHLLASAVLAAHAGGARAALPDAVIVKLSGQVNYGVSYRLEAPDPNLLNVFNAAASGQRGLASGAQNSDDADTNFRRGDATASVLKALADLNVTAGPFNVLLRGRGWRDLALRNRARAFGNSANNYVAGMPLSDAGAPSRSRFSGAQLTDYLVQYQERAAAGAWSIPLLLRLGQQVIPWGEWPGSAGGISGVNGTDLPGLRRPGSVAQEEGRVATPALFARVGLGDGWTIDGYVQTAFRPSADEMCGSFLSVSDYAVPGCDRVMAGVFAGSDRQRVLAGAFMQRLALQLPDAPAQHGLALQWRGAATEIGLYRARMTSRSAFPGLQKSTRDGPALIPGDPDGKNMRFFTEYPADVDVSSLAVAHQMGTLRLAGELSYRAGQPLLLSPSDVIPAFLSSTVASLLRADASGTVAGGLFHGSDRYRVVHATLALQGGLGSAAAVHFTGIADLVLKHVIGLPDQSVRRYGRADQFGAGPVFGVCAPNMALPALQCNDNGYVSSNAWAARLRVEAHTAALAPGLDAVAGLSLTDDVHGWAYDGVVNQGRKRAIVSVRLVYRQRYLAELMATPVWGGDYNAQSDRDLLSLSVGIRF